MRIRTHYGKSGAKEYHMTTVLLYFVKMFSNYKLKGYFAGLNLFSETNSHAVVSGFTHRFLTSQAFPMGLDLLCCAVKMQLDIRDASRSVWISRKICIQKLGAK